MDDTTTNPNPAPASDMPAAPTTGDQPAGGTTDTGAWTPPAQPAEPTVPPTDAPANPTDQPGGATGGNGGTTA